MSTEFRIKSSMWVGIAGVLLLSPFTINHLRQGRMLFAVGTGVIVLAMAAMWFLGLRRRYLPWLVFAVLAPAILAFLVLALREQGVIGALWCFPAVLLFYFTLPEKLAWAANLTLYVVVAPPAATFLDLPIAARVAATLLGVSAFSAIFVRVMTLQQAELEERAVTDPLTGLNNRALLGTTLEQSLEQSQRTGTPMTVLALDLDKFKSINDSLGHDAGDEVLRGMADVLRERLRKSDRAFRLGGEEFLAFLFGSDHDQGMKVAEQLRATVEGKDLLPDRTVTVSIGVASPSEGDDWEAWLKRADENLYRAKNEGRNRVVG